LPRHLDAGKILAGDDLQIREGLVVLEVDVELRLDVFDEPIFEEQGVDFAGGA
jgi:hypothetical protein